MDNNLLASGSQFMPFDGMSVLDRMERAVQLVRERLDRSTNALESKGIEYAIGGSNATAVWIASVDESAVRQARNVELVLRRDDLTDAAVALESAGFVETNTDKGLRFLDGPSGKSRDAIEITFGGEPVVGKSPQFLAPNPIDSETVDGRRVLRLGSLVQFQLARYRLDDAVDLRDMIDVGLVDASWIASYSPELVDRLQHLLDTPDG